jgi:hypothetical protein
MTYAELTENLHDLERYGYITIEKLDGKCFDAILNL